MVRHSITVVFALAIALSAFAQGDFVNPNADQSKLKPLPTGVILIPGAIPSASDSKTPLPERSVIDKNVYSNRYFGLSYTFPEEWIEEFEGPPPSDSGLYVLAQIVPSKSFKGNRGSILITAQDQFFGYRAANDVAEQVKDAFAHLPNYYKAERQPTVLTIADRKFLRYDYGSPVAELHWAVVTTQIRCHAVQFVFTSRDTEVLDQLVESLSHMRLNESGPRCVPNYAKAENIENKVNPILSDRRFNPIPVRITIGKTGKVQHVHVLSAFSDQAQIITDALFQWRFKPYVVDGEPVEIETGILFGAQPYRRREAHSPSAVAQ